MAVATWVTTNVRERVTERERAALNMAVATCVTTNVRERERELL